MHRHFNKVLGGIDAFPGKQLLIVFASLLKRGLLKKGNNLEQISHKSCIPYKRWRKKYQPSGHTTLKQRRLNFDHVLMKQRRFNLTLTGRFFLRCVPAGVSSLFKQSMLISYFLLFQVVWPVSFLLSVSSIVPIQSSPWNRFEPRQKPFSKPKSKAL